MSHHISGLEAQRLQYKPKLPPVLASGKIKIEAGKVVPSQDKEHWQEIEKEFSTTSKLPVVKLVEGEGNLSNDALKVGVVLSGGPAAGGHNAIAGLFDALKAANRASQLFGFLGGPKGIFTNKWVELTAEAIAPYRNTGGFDMIGSGRDKIEKPEQLEGCEKTAKALGLNALVIIGGDDSNTNAAILAEYCAAKQIPLQVIGLPKTIDGDMRNEFIDMSFGFDTAVKTYAYLVGNICRDARSGGKYWHFIKLMGRSASHVTLEVALQTQPNLAIISEEVKARGLTLNDVVEQICDTIAKRAEGGKNYGVVLIPEGLLEFLADFNDFLRDIGHLLGQHGNELAALPPRERIDFVSSKLPDESAKLYRNLPASFQETILQRDAHGNLLVSQLETEKFLADLVEARLADWKEQGRYSGKFSAITHFFGYEGRCGFPTNFDADYTYCLGYAAAQLIRGGLTGYTVSAKNLAHPVEKWEFGGVPVASMVVMEHRKGALKPVIKKALVELDSPAFKYFAKHRDMWSVEDAYKSPGPIQYFGPPEICDSRNITMLLEAGIAV
ncbi:MAG: diphosphate--fructose-6-phosphate 1-phosphotransferase [Candidatus Sumerlaeaceae bacterium]|nr:diphosphate--fructose-6-phosphate 1-phosphotransferase [Candidatus Sumerlaeaceae bacterium]